MNAPENSLPAANDTLARYEILDTPPEAAFDDIARRAAEAVRAPMSGISFFDPAETTISLLKTPNSSGENSRTGRREWREWFKARHHLPISEFSVADCFYQPALLPTKRSQKPFVVNDALSDKRLRDHPLVGGPPYLCFYAGAGIFSRANELIGVLSVFDTVGRDLTHVDAEALTNLANLIGARLEARAEARRERRLHALNAPTVNDDPSAKSSAEQRIEHLTAEFVRLENLLEDEITIRQAAEDKLRAEKEFSDAAIQSLPGSFYMFDVNGEMVRWNSSFQHNTGYSPTEITAHRVLDFIADSDRAAVADALRRIFEHGDDISMEAQMRHRDGNTVPYSFHGRPLDIDGKRYCIGVGRDITERKKSEGEIRAAKERLDFALSGSSLALWDWDVAHDTIYFNQGWSTLLGGMPTETRYRGEEVIAQCHAEDSARFRAALMHALKGDHNDLNIEYRTAAHQGEWIWIHTRGKVTERDEYGRARRMTGTSANITNRKLAEDRGVFSDPRLTYRTAQSHVVK